MTINKNKDQPFFVLRLNPTTEAKTCFASICSGSVATTTTDIGLGYIKFGMMASTHYGVGLLAFLTVMSVTYNHLEKRAMNRGQFHLKKHMAPKITI